MDYARLPQGTDVSSSDGKQAIIDLAVYGKRRLTWELCVYLEALGYDVPEEIYTEAPSGVHDDPGVRSSR